MVAFVTDFSATTGMVMNLPDPIFDTKTAPKDLPTSSTLDVCAVVSIAESTPLLALLAHLS